MPSADPGQAKVDCPELRTDQDTIEVTWFGPGARRDHLSLYFGCGHGSGHFPGDPLLHAPDLLQVKPILEALATKLHKL